MTFGGGGKAGNENELVDLRFRELGRLGLRDEPLRDRLGLDARRVEATAVVGDLDDDVAALVVGGEADAAALRLALHAALVRPLEAVVGGIAHHVGERVLDQIEHLAIELGLGALHVEIDLLAELGGKIAHDARQFLPGVADRLHARLHHAFLQLGGDVGQALQRPLEFRNLRGGERFPGAGCG